MHNSKTKWLISVITIALMFNVVTVVNAQSNILATLSVNRNEITVGDVVPLTLQVTHPAGWRVIVPALDKQWGEFELRNQSVPTIAAHGDGTETTSQTIEVTRMRPGEAQTPALTLAIADERGNLQNVEVAPVRLTVQSVLVNGDTELRDIKPQANLVTSQRTLTPIMIVSMLGLTALIVYGVKRWRNRPVIDRRTPRERALAALKALEARKPQTPTDLKAACVDLAGCARAYIAATMPLPARDLTTSELARQLKAHDVPAEWSVRMIEVLRVCDSVKFADEAIDAALVRNLIGTVEFLIEQYPSASAQPAPKARRINLKGTTA